MDNSDLEPLSDADIEERVGKLSRWTFKDNKISKEFTFPAFADAIAFVDLLAPFCDKVDHHPDIHIFYNKILFELQTFDSGEKVTGRDFVVAEEIERLSVTK